MKIWRNLVTFYLGGMGYMGLELLWRGRTHGSMFVAGGLSFLLVGQLNRTEPRLSLPWRAAAGAGIITMVELAAGMLINRDYAVWDYRARPGNFMGQICPLYMALWLPASLAILLLYDRVEESLP